MPTITRIDAFAIRSDLNGGPPTTAPRRPAWTADAEVAGPVSKFPRYKKLRAAWRPTWPAVGCLVQASDGNWGFGVSRYGAPVIDISHWWVGADLQRVVGTMRNFIPERMVRETGQVMRMNIDDGDIYIGEFANGVLTSIQTSFVTIGNYPGIEARLYGEKGAIICRLVEEFGVAETIKIATPDGVEFKQMEIPQHFYPPGGHARESWRSLFYANLIRDFIDEILDGGDRNQGNFDDGAWVQETINAVERSFHEERWVRLPLDGEAK